MNDYGHNSVAREHLRAIVERIERIESEIADRNGDKRDVYAEAKANGFDVKVLKKLIADRRKDATERQEFDAIYDLYAHALGMLPDFEPETGTGLATRVHAHETEFPNPAPPRGDGERPYTSPDARAQNAEADLHSVGLVGESPNLHTFKSGQQDAGASQDRNEPVSDAPAIATNSADGIPEFLRRAKGGR